VVLLDVSVIVSAMRQDALRHAVVPGVAVAAAEVRREVAGGNALQ